MASRVGVNLRASAYLHQGDRKYMEDEFQVAYQRTNDKKDIEYSFFGIFDGHGGKEAAHFAKDNLMDFIVSQRLFWSENDDDVLRAIKEGFLQTHMLMWKEVDRWPRTASGWPSTSGTTASVAFIRRQKIYIGHVGDSGIVLGYEDSNDEWLGVSLTRDHKPESILELTRIMECGGKVIAKSGVPRVVWNRPKSGHLGPVRRSTPMDEIPFLAVARSLGDLWSYNARKNQFVVSPEPDVCVIDIDINHHRCLVFGTDGLWNALSPSAAVNIAYNSEKNNEKHYLGVPTGCGKQHLWINPSRCIVIGALERYMRVSLRADNTSAVTVYLDPPGRPKREVLIQQFALKKGAQSKTTPPKFPNSKKSKEASVKVHVYNQNPGGGGGDGSDGSEDGNRGVMWMKERGSDSPTGGGGEKDQGGGENKEVESTRVSQDNRVTSVSSEDERGKDVKERCGGEKERCGGEKERGGGVKERGGGVKERGGGVKERGVASKCKECGCDKSSGHTHHLNSSSSSDTASPIPSTPVDTPTVGLATPTPKTDSRHEKTKSDAAIQIPFVSSSTVVDGGDESGKDQSTTGLKNLKKADISSSILSKNMKISSSIVSKNVKKSDISSIVSKKLKKSDLASSVVVKGTTTRRTRSCVELPSPKKSENKEETPKSLNSGLKPFEGDTTNRILKSINRSCMKMTSSSRFLSAKRKRRCSVDAEDELDRPGKSLRVNTRSQTISYKSMITRSQGKGQRRSN